MWPDEHTCCQLSTFISRDFHLDVRNAFNTNLSRMKTVLTDMAWRCKKDIDVISGGSATEGTETSQSDTDAMMSVPDMRVITSGNISQQMFATSSTSQLRQNDVTKSFCREFDDEIIHCDETQVLSEPKHINLYHAVSKWSKPGYVRLVSLNVSKIPAKTFLEIENMLTETPEGIFLSSEKYTQTNSQMAEHNRPVTLTDIYKHGPCVTTTFQTIYGFRTERSDLDLDIDLCMAIECDQWPEEAKEWVTRERKHSWPPQDLIEKISKFKCFAVPVGDATSESADLEWRVSFLPGEREMIWSLNDTQIQCYIILKMLRQNLIEPLAPDTISSYHLKTIIFWMVENEGSAQWTNNNLLTCVRKCLSALKLCIVQGELQHYFHRKNNLFRSKFGNRHEKEAVINMIAQIQGNIGHILENGLLETSIISKMWKCHSDCNSLIDMCNDRPEVSDMFNVNKRANSIIRFSSSILLLCNYLAATMTTLDCLLTIYEGMECLVPNDSSESYIELFKHFIDIRLGITSYVHSSWANTLSERELFAIRAKMSLESGQGFENFTSKFYMAAYHLAIKDFVQCRETVLKELTTEKVIVYTGQCSKNVGIITGIEAEDDIYAHTTFLPITGKQDEIVNTAVDIIVSKHDAAFVPEPLRYECAMFSNYGDGSFLLHPLVYAELLLFLSYYYENDIHSARNSLRKFEEVVWDLGYTPLRYQALNIVGYCFAMVGEFDISLSCYMDSLKETYLRHKVRNAAGYLAGVLLVRAMASRRDKNGGWVETIYQRKTH